MTVLVLLFAGITAILYFKTETSSYSSLLQESDDRIYLSISKYSTDLPRINCARVLFVCIV